MSVEHRTRSLDDEGHRKTIHPTEVRGIWHSRRQVVQAFLIVFFLVLPWLKIGDHPLLLLDLVERKFSIFGFLFHTHDVPLLFLVVISFILFFGLMTALFGRVWCGWACPQTVFIESLFRRIERWIEGKAIERRKKENEPLGFDRILEKTLKWFLFSLATLLITHSVLAIFVGTEKLWQMIQMGPAESPTSFLFIVISSLVILLDFGWFREQFCIVVCPYGRIQSVFQDTQTKTVTYDTKRPDCVDCSRCVQVCPTGIDIRNGSSQLECIACTACIDACDDVMARLKKPLGLIRYDSVEKTESRFWLRGRSIAYGSLLLSALVALLWVSSHRTAAMVEVFKNRGAPYAILEHDGVQWIANTFIAEIANRKDEPLEVRFVFGSQNYARMIMPNNPIVLSAGEYARQPFTIEFKKSALKNGKFESQIKAEITFRQGKETYEKGVTLVGPF